MTIKFEIMPKTRIAFVRQVGPYGTENIQAMEALKKWAKKNKLLNGSSILLGIAQDNPETTLPENCRYDACIVISDDYHLNKTDNNIFETEFAGGNYVTYEVKHTAEDIQKAWVDIFPELSKSGYQIDNKPIFERYIGDMMYNNYCEICIPVKAL